MQFLFRRWLEPTVANPDDRQRATMLNWMALGLMISSLAFAVGCLAALSLAGADRWILGVVLCVSLVLLGALTLAWYVGRRGKIGLAVLIPGAAVCLVMVGATFALGTGHVTVLGYAVATVIMGTLAGMRPALGVVILSTGAHGVAFYLEQHGVLVWATPPVNTGSIVVAVATGLAGALIVVRLGERQLHKAIEAARRSERDATASAAKLSESLERLRATQAVLEDTSRSAGMAEIATGILHNMGNVLNSITISSSLLEAKIKQLRVERIGSAVDLVEQHGGSGGGASDDRRICKDAFAYLRAVGEALISAKRDLGIEMTTLIENIHHLKGVLATQQEYAAASGMIVTFPIRTAVEDALALADHSNPRGEITVVRDFGGNPSVTSNRHKVVQILTNLLRNAEDALLAGGKPERIIRIEVGDDSDHQVSVRVADNGCGIAPADLASVFRFGFTTKPTGRGFGLHHSALTAQDLGGNLTCQSDGVGRGACFTLTLPRWAANDTTEPGTSSLIGGHTESGALPAPRA
jgi:signal transduction histidine kinase